MRKGDEEEWNEGNKYELLIDDINKTNCFSSSNSCHGFSFYPCIKIHPPNIESIKSSVHLSVAFQPSSFRCIDISLAHASVWCFFIYKGLFFVYNKENSFFLDIITLIQDIFVVTNLCPISNHNICFRSFLGTEELAVIQFLYFGNLIIKKFKNCIDFFLVL